MTKETQLRVLSIAHTAVSRNGRLRYHPLAKMSGLEVHLLAPARWREYGRKLTADPGGDPGIVLHVEPILLRYLPAVNWHAHFYPRLNRIIELVKPGVIHVAEEPWSFVALQATILRGSAALVLEVEQNVLRRLPPPFEQIRRHVLARTDLLLSRNPDATMVARACGFTGPARPLGYGVDQGIFFPKTEQKLTRRAGGLLRIGYVGRLIEEKGIEDALTALNLSRSPLEVALMGQGPHEKALRNRVNKLGLEKRVSIRGWGNVSDVADFLRSLDVSFLLSRSAPTWREQFGRVIIESQSCGVPVIGSSSGAIPSVIADGGWIVPEREPEALARLLDRIRCGEDEILAKAAAGSANVVSRFTYEATAKAMAASWREAYAQRRPEAPPSRASRKIELGAPPVERPDAKGKEITAFQIVQIAGELGTGGGVEMVAWELAKAWRRAGIQNKTLTRRTGPGVENSVEVQIVARWLADISVRGSSAIRYLSRLLVVPAFSLAATAALRKYRNALIVSHNGDPFTGDVLVVHSLHSAMLEAKRQAGIWKWLLNPLNIWYAVRDRVMIGGLRYTKYIAVSRRLAQEIRNYHKVPDRLISIIPNGIDLEKFKPDPAARERIRREFGIEAQAKLILFAGNDFEGKGLAFAIGALNLMESDVFLLAVGSGGNHPSYRRLLRGSHRRLMFAGERSDMPSFYAAADAFVLPSRYETFSLACMEAMASGVPVFATRVGGIEDYLEDGVNGYGIERDGAAIAAKIRPVLSDGEHLAALRQGARATAQRYGWDNVAAIYTALLREVWELKFGAGGGPKTNADFPSQIGQQV